jgi:hypothetical protein
MKNLLLLICAIHSIHLNAQFANYVIVGNTKFDLQTYGSASNLISVNNDNSISTCWTFSPDDNFTIPPYPFRGTGYNYYDSSTQIWSYAFPNLPTNRTENSRTGFTNIVVTPSGHEMTIAHQAVTSTTFSRLAINYRATKGTGLWALSSPWGSAGFHTWAKAAGGITNENVYVIWDGSGAPPTITSPPNIVNGQNGPLMFGRSLDGGLTWEPAKFIHEIDSNFYDGFQADCYSIDATGDTVAIAIGYELTDIILLKSVDAGQTWTKTIVLKNPIPFPTSCNCVSNYIIDGIPIDTIRAGAGDPEVLIDNNGMCHVWFSALDYYIDSARIIVDYSTDNLFYWNENLGPDTTTVWDPILGGHGGYVSIAHAEDFNGNGKIDIPVDTNTCGPTYHFGLYGMGLTQMPSAGISENFPYDGRIFLCFSTINELADTTGGFARRHLYGTFIDPPYIPNSWHFAENLIPSLADGGNGEFEECVFGSMARNAINNTAYILYQADSIPGTTFSPIGSCLSNYNQNILNDIRVTKYTPFPTAIEKILFADESRSAFPVPSIDKLNLQFILSKNSSVSLEIKDMSGKIIKSFPQTKYLIGKNIFSIDISDIPSGIYLYSIYSATNILPGKFIVSR